MTILAAFMVPHPPLIIPDVGKGGEEQIRATIDAYENVASQIAELRPETIIITSPHAVMYADYFHISDGKGATGSFSRFGASQVSFKETYDTELRDEICALADEMQFPAGVLGERDKNLDHGVMVPLYFIRKKYNDFRILRSGLSGLALSDHYRYGMMIRKAVEKTGRKCVIIASGDLFTAEDGVRVLNETGVSCVMYARGALKDPRVFADHRRLLEGRPAQPADLIGIMRRHICLARKFSPQDSFLKMRTFLPRYMKGMDGAKALRQEIVSCRGWDDLESVLAHFNGHMDAPSEHLSPDTPCAAASGSHDGNIKTGDPHAGQD